MIRAGGAVPLIGAGAFYLVLAIGLVIGAGVIVVTQPATLINVLMIVVLVLSGFAFVYVALLYLWAFQRRDRFSLSHEGSELIVSDHLGSFRIKADDVQSYAVASRIKVQLRSDLGIRNGTPFTKIKGKLLTIAPMFIEGDVPALLKQFDPQFDRKHKVTVEGVLDKFQ